MITDGTDILIQSSSFQGSFGEHPFTSMYATQSAIEVLNCLFAGNSADKGGAIYALGSNITLTNSAFIGNRASSRGGAIFASNSTILMTNGELFSDNEAKTHGGAIYAQFSSIITEKSTKNFTRTGKCCMNTTLLLESVNGVDDKFFSGSPVASFCNNRASVGGAIADNGILKIFGYSLFSDNNAVSRGGAIYHSQGAFTLAGSSSFISNSAPERGGAIYMHGGDFVLSGSTQFTTNRSNRGGAIFVIFSVTVLYGNIKFQDNSALDGGAMYSVASELHSTSSMLNFVGNVAERRGGGLAVVDTESLVYVSGNFTDNTAKVCGGALSLHLKILELQFAYLVTITSSCFAGQQKSVETLENLAVE